MGAGGGAMGAGGAMEATTMDGDGAGLLRARLAQGEGVGDHCPSDDTPNFAEGDSGGDLSGVRSDGEDAGEETGEGE